jgi:predicted small lipoprotein YifL
MKCLVRTGLIVYVAGTLLACGQKGPLVLPDAAAKRKHTLPTLPAPGGSKNTEHGPAPAPGNPATSPAPPASPAGAPNSTPPPQ